MCRKNDTTMNLREFRLRELERTYARPKLQNNFNIGPLEPAIEENIMTFSKELIGQKSPNATVNAKRQSQITIIQVSSLQDPGSLASSKSPATSA